MKNKESGGSSSIIFNKNTISSDHFKVHEHTEEDQISDAPIVKIVDGIFKARFSITSQ